MIGAGLTVTAAMALGMIATIGGIALAATFTRDRFISLLAKTEAWRGRAGFVLETGSSILVIAFGAWTLTPRSSASLQMARSGLLSRVVPRPLYSQERTKAR